VSHSRQCRILPTIHHSLLLIKSLSSSRSRRRKILPLGPLGIWSRNNTPPRSCM
jgi:hypothetical protein